MPGSSISITFEDGTSSEMTFSRRISRFSISDGDVGVDAHRRDGEATTGAVTVQRTADATTAPPLTAREEVATSEETDGDASGGRTELEDDLLGQPWSLRVQIGLVRGGVRSWSDLAGKTDREMLWLCDGSKQALQEIRQRLRERGLSLTGGDTVIIHPNETLAEA
jgi:hypothetical protein